MIITREDIEKARSHNGKLVVRFQEDLDENLYKSFVPSISSQIEEAKKRGDSIQIKIEAIHAGLTRNFTYYKEDKLENSVHTWLSPYNKPVLTHHFRTGEPIGRVVDARYLKQSLLKKGFGCIELTCDINDKDAIEKILDGRYLTVSIGAETDSVVCSICGTDILNEGWCEHNKGEKYNSKGEPDPDGELCYWIVGNLNFDEVSFVNIPSDSTAMITVVSESAWPIKESFSASEAVVPFQNLPIAEKGRGWDQAAARQRILRYAGGPDKEKVDWDKYRRAFLWYDSEKPNNVTSYKFPIADVVNGRLMAIPEAISAAAARLANWSGDGKEQMYSHLAKYYKKMGIDPPWVRRKKESLVTPDDLPSDAQPSEELLALLADVGEEVKEYIEKLWSIVVSLSEEVESKKEEITRLEDELSTAIAQNQQLADEKAERERESAQAKQEKENLQTTVDSLMNELRESVIGKIKDLRISLGLDTEESFNKESFTSQSIDSLKTVIGVLSEMSSKNNYTMEKVRNPGFVIKTDVAGICKDIIISEKSDEKELENESKKEKIVSDVKEVLSWMKK